MGEGVNKGADAVVGREEIKAEGAMMVSEALGERSERGFPFGCSSPHILRASYERPPPMRGFLPSGVAADHGRTFQRLWCDCWSLHHGWWHRCRAVVPVLRGARSGLRGLR